MTKRPTVKSEPSNARKDRLAKALRDNLRRRKTAKKKTIVSKNSA